MPVFNAKQIKDAITEGRIACHPFTAQNTHNNGIVLTLGHNYYRVERSKDRTIYNPFDPEDVERYFDGPYKAMPHNEWCKLNGLSPVRNVPLDHPVISLKPGERILAHSHEFIGAGPSVSLDLRPLPEWIQSGISITSAIGSSPNRLVLEIINLNQRETLLLPIGEPVALVLASSVDETEPGALPDMDSVIKIWSPDMLLPKAYVQQRKLPPKVEGAQYE